MLQLLDENEICSLEIKDRIYNSLLEGPKTFYDLTKKEKIGGNRTVLKALDELLGYSNINKSEPQGPRNAMPYTITSRGINYFFRKRRDILVENIDEIAKKHKDKSYMFKYWDEFKKKGISEDIKNDLKNRPHFINYISQPRFIMLLIYFYSEATCPHRYRKDGKLVEEKSDIKKPKEKLNYIINLLQHDENFGKILGHWGFMLAVKIREVKALEYCFKKVAREDLLESVKYHQGVEALEK